jgi:hypothetical protein
METIQLEKDERITVKLPPSVKDDLDAFCKTEKIPFRTDGIKRLIQFYESQKQGLRIATFKSLIDPLGRDSRDDPPVAICGKAGEGRSFSLDVLLRECEKKQVPFILFNSSAPRKGKRKQPLEHSWIEKKITAFKAESFSWLRRPKSHLVQMDPRLDFRQSVIKSFCERLLQLEGEPRLKDWVLVFEEASDYEATEEFSTVLRRMRKYVRRLIVVTTETNLFGMCESFRPLPRMGAS